MATDSPCFSCDHLRAKQYGNSYGYYCEKEECYIHPDLMVSCENQKWKMPIKDSGDRTQFESGAVRDMHEGKGRFDLLPMCVLLRLARHYEQGAIKYSDRNWEKGIPAHSFADSALRHMVKYMDGQNDEDHLIAAIWNLCGLAWTEEKKPWMMDIPARMQQEEDDYDG